MTYVEPIATVYRFYAADDAALYVGCSQSVGNRLAGHARKDWWPEVAYCWFDHYPTRAEALEVERHLIDSLQPKYNLRGVRGDRPPNERAA